MSSRLRTLLFRRLTTLVAVAVVVWAVVTVLDIVPWFLALVVAGIATLVVDFVLFFVVPYARTRRSLLQFTERLGVLYQEVRDGQRVVVNKARIGEAAAERPNLLLHLWEEFDDTLHEQHSDNEVDNQGQPTVTKIRQTVPAEMYFNARTLIDAPLNTDYFRHLPGILTGLGIVGTFSGLIAGLSSFAVTGEVAQAQEGTAALIDAVREAFVISAIAIGLAMVITWIEKTLVARLGDDVLNLQVALDQMFDAGVDEEYLSAIADKSEQSAVELGRLRQGLAEDLRDAIGQLGDRIEAATEAGAIRTADLVSAPIVALAGTVRDGHDALGTRIEAAVHKGAEKTGQIVTAELHQPLASMTALLEKSAADQQSGVQELLTGTLEQFASRLEDVVGDKLGTAAGHVTAAADLIGTALTDAPKAMEVASASVATTLERSGAEAREALVATTTGVRATIESASIEASRAIEATTHGARETMEATLAGVRATIEESGTATRDTLAAIADAATPMVGHAERISAASAALATSIEQGERTLDGAIERLRAVGVSLTAAVASADAAAAALNGAASASRGGSEATTQAAGELRAAGEAIGKGTSELARATEIQRSENDTRQALAEAVQRSAAELRVAQESLDDFLAGLSSALEASHREFAQRLTETVTRANSAIADELARATTAVGQAVGFLNEAIEDELGPTVDGLVTELQRIVPTTATSRS